MTACELLINYTWKCTVIMIDLAGTVLTKWSKRTLPIIAHTDIVCPLRGCTEKYMVFHPKMLHLIIRKDSKFQIKVHFATGACAPKISMAWKIKEKESSCLTRSQRQGKHAIGHYWDTWGNMNMNYMLDNNITPMLNFLSIIISCGCVGECIRSVRD